ncbi:MAG: hypothetical protein R2710_03385 [Acidimicrobiales bacterium]
MFAFHQLEFLSDDWIAAARDFFERAQSDGRLAAVGPFAVCERFDNAPLHLALADDRATWFVRFDGSSVEVGRGVDDQADLLVEGDYQAALAAAQWVGIGSTAARAAMWREVSHLHGSEALRVSGELRPEVDALLVQLHDTLGRRTVENPDLAHRARRQASTATWSKWRSRGSPCSNEPSRTNSPTSSGGPHWRCWSITASTH